MSTLISERPAPALQPVNRQIYTKVLSLGGLCECKHQIDRIGLESDSCFFDYVVAPTKSIPKAVRNGLAGIFDPSNLLIVKPWDGTTYKVLDQDYGISNVHDFEIHRTVGANLKEIGGKFGHLAYKFVTAMTDPTPTVFFHRVTTDEACGVADSNDLFEVFDSLRVARGVNPFHLVLITIDGVVRPHQARISFYQRPTEAAYNWKGNDQFWDHMIEDLRSRGLL